MQCLPVHKLICIEPRATNFVEICIFFCHFFLQEKAVESVICMSFHSQCVLLISISIHVLVVPVLWLKSSSSHETENQSCPHKQIQAALGSFYKVSGKSTITLHQYPFWYSQLQDIHLTNPTMHLSHIPQYNHSEQKCAHFCSQWCIVGYGTGALWDLCNSSLTMQLVF